jgi:hypothetical protein
MYVPGKERKKYIYVNHMPGTKWTNIINFMQITKASYPVPERKEEDTSLQGQHNHFPEIIHS